MPFQSLGEKIGWFGLGQTFHPRAVSPYGNGKDVGTEYPRLPLLLLGLLLRRGACTQPGAVSGPDSLTYPGPKVEILKFNIN